MLCRISSSTWSSSLKARNATVFVFALLLAGCGFRLQGYAGYPPVLAQTYIQTQDRYSEFYRQLRATLQQGGVELVSSPADATAVIKVEADETGQKVLTVSGRNVPTEYDVYYTIGYSVWGREVAYT